MSGHGARTPWSFVHRAGICQPILRVERCFRKEISGLRALTFICRLDDAQSYVQCKAKIAVTSVGQLYSSGTTQNGSLATKLTLERWACELWGLVIFRFSSHIPASLGLPRVTASCLE